MLTRCGLNSHVIKNHDKSDIECEQCGKFFVSREELCDHRTTHTIVNPSIESISNMLQNLLDKEDKTSHVVVDGGKHREPIHKTERPKDESTKEKIVHKYILNGRKLECGQPYGRET